MPRGKFMQRGGKCVLFDWSSENNWIAPSIFIITDVLKHARNCKAIGTLVVQKWQSASFSPLIVEDNGTLKKFIYESVEYVKPRHFLISRNHKNIFSEKFPSNVLVLQVHFRDPIEP